MDVAGTINFRIVEQHDDQVVGEMPLDTGLLNPFGTVHAGAILWFADVCATALAFGNRDMTEGISGFPLAVSLNANLLGNQKSGTFRATARFVKKGRRLTVVRTSVTGADGRIIAEVTTTHVPA
ncbi:PaaI family thioesterase [Polycyclovorans algicola]|uniref:PaaI family thioesterase n=1 Tax=Polycyclovorans algicola TaxID=616992 RepID=UPI0004A6EFED|nr:PaaI family thioesterase [Polycyclovorans algicola]